MTKKKDGTAPGYIFVGPKKDVKQRGPLIVTNSGQVVWFKQVEPHEATDFKVQTYRGKRVLTWWEGKSQFGIGQGVGMIYDDHYRKIAEVHAGHGYHADLHEFRLTPKGTALMTIYHAVPAHQSLKRFGGRAHGLVQDGIFQEVDVATGKVVFEWHSLGHIALGESYTRIRPVKKHGKTIYPPFDYFHPNSIQLQPDGNFLVSGRNTRALYLISRKTGKIIWRLGGKKSDFKLGPGVRFAWQHDAELHPGGLLTLFDNESMPPVRKHSRALELNVDFAAKTVTVKKEFIHPKGLLAPHQGDTQLLPDGHVFVGYGGLPYYTEYDQNGKVLFDAHMAKGIDSYRAYRFVWHATPAVPPKVVVTRRSSGRLNVWVSWNGATDVSQWDVLAGDSSSSLSSVRTVDKKGFETEIPVKTSARWIAVKAVDSSGKALGTSVPVHTPAG